MVEARPRPRTRSRVACTSSRTPGRDSSTPSAATVSRCVSRPTRCSSGATAASSASSVRAATHSSSAAAKTGEEKWSPSISTTARVRRPPAGSCATAPASSAPAQLGEVLDGGDDEVVLGREVVQLRAAAHPRPLGDERGRRPGEAALDQQLDRRLQQPRPASRGCGRPAARGSRRRGTGRSRAPPCRRTNKQSSLTFISGRRPAPKPLKRCGRRHLTPSEEVVCPASDGAPAPRAGTQPKVDEAAQPAAGHRVREDVRMEPEQQPRESFGREFVSTLGVEVGIGVLRLLLVVVPAGIGYLVADGTGLLPGASVRLGPSSVLLAVFWISPPPPPPPLGVVVLAAGAAGSAPSRRQALCPFRAGFLPVATAEKCADHRLTGDRDSGENPPASDGRDRQHHPRPLVAGQPAPPGAQQPTGRPGEEGQGHHDGRPCPRQRGERR